MSIANRDALIAGLAGGVTYAVVKRSGSNAALVEPARQDAWGYHGSPPPGTVPSTATICTNVTTGAIPLATAAAGKNWYIATWTAANGDSGGEISLWDRLCHRTVAGNTTTSSLGMLLPARVTDYSTVCAFVTTTGGMSFTSVQLASYTNQAGTTGRVGATSTGASYMTAGGVPTLQLPLASGDTGIQAVASFTHAGSTGTINLILARCLVPGLAPIAEAATMQGWSSIVNAGPDPCLYVVHNASGVGANRQVHGLIRAFQA
ncbi:MAG TPA: hypothetical protein VE326_11510 [Candidatus Binatia bacterium]|nr:hypothetical protein [Candidatus Binatia bacterium]